MWAKKRTSTECINHVAKKLWSWGNIKVNIQWVHMTKCRNKQMVLVVKHMQVSIYIQSNGLGSKSAAVEEEWVKSCEWNAMTPNWTLQT